MKPSIGISLPRLDALDKARGITRYLPDRTVDRMVYAYPVFSPVPHGKLRGLDISRAEREPGFLRLFTAEDVPGKNRIGVVMDDQPLFAHDTLLFVGDTVGLAVAETEEAAWRAAQAVEVKSDPLPPVLKVADSRTPESPKLHESNIACEHRVVIGDAEAELKKCAHVIEGTVHTPWQEHFYLEPQGCIAVPEDDGSMTIYGSIQCVFYVQKAIAPVLGIPFAKVRVVQTPIGGAFGGKEDIPSEVCTRTALAAWHLRRPVRTVYRRRDDVQVTSKRHPSEMHYRVGVDEKGVIQAGVVRIHLNAGAYATLSSVVSYRAAMQALGPYRVPHVNVHSTAWYTNTPPNGAFRGFGSPQATFGHERMMDKIAAALKMDPVEFRLINVVERGSKTMTGQRLDVSVGAGETIRKSAEAAEWTKRFGRSQQDPRYLRGIGISASHYGNCLGAAGWVLDGAGAKIQVRRDGSIAVAYGLVDMGQGSTTAVAQMAAEALGVDPGRIAIMPTDTMNVPDSGPSVASRNVVMTGNALRDAASHLLPVFREAAAQPLGCVPDDVTIADDYAEGPDGKRVTFSEVAELMYLMNLPMDALGWWHVPKLEYDAKTGVGEAYFTYSYATHVAEVVVDSLTGKVHVERVWAAHDVGKAINPAGLAAQVEGGVAQGVGWALYEHFQLEQGKVISGNLSTYLLPTARDVPETETIIVEDPDPRGPWGAKGIGEPAIIPTGAAVANAVSHAIGCDVDELPILPERVLELLTKTRGEKR